METKKIERLSLINCRLNLAITFLAVAALLIFNAGNILFGVCALVGMAILICIKIRVRSIFKVAFVNRLNGLVETTLKEYMTINHGFRVKAVNSFKYNVAVYDKMSYSTDAQLRTMVDLAALDAKMGVKVSVVQGGMREHIAELLGAKLITY